MVIESILVLFGFGIVIFLTWCLTVPIPEGFSRPKILKIMLGVVKVHTVYYQALDKLRLRRFLDSCRTSMDRIVWYLWIKKSSKLSIEDTEFDGVKVRLYKPVHATEGLPGMVYYHGGGWSACKPELYDIMMIKMSKILNMMIVNVDYRLAPEFPFPVPLEDCVTATKYFLSNASSFGVNPDRVVIGGDSAGGNLAAAVALKLRDEKFQLKPHRMMLIYPALQAVDFLTPSMIQNNSTPLIPREVACYFWSLYIGGSSKYQKALLNNQHTTISQKQKLAEDYVNHSKLGKDFLYHPYDCTEKLVEGDKIIVDAIQHKVINPYLSPLLAEDLSGMPDTYIFTAHYDVFRDDGIHFARRLREAGVEVILSNMKSGFHGVAGFIMVFREGKDFFNGILNDLRAHL